MAYRDAEETLRARVEELETELASARETVARMQGLTETPAAKDGKPMLLLGMPRIWRREKELPVAVNDRGFERIADLLRQRFGANHRLYDLSQIGSSLTFTALQGSVRVTRSAEARTTIRVEVDHRRWSVLSVAGAICTTFMGLPTVNRFLSDLGARPWSLLIVLPMVIFASSFLLRWPIKYLSSREHKRMLGVMESIGEVVQAEGMHDEKCISVSDEVAAPTPEDEIAEDEQAVEEARKLG